MIKCALVSFDHIANRKDDRAVNMNMDIQFNSYLIRTVNDPDPVSFGLLTVIGDWRIELKTLSFFN